MKKWMLVMTLLALLLAGCARTEEPQPQTLRVLTHSSFDIGKELITAFEEKYNAKVEFIDGGDTGTALNKAVLSKDNPLADVFYGVDNTFLSRALQEGVFVAYSSPALDDIPAELILDDQHRLLPVDWADVCLNYDRAWFADRGLEPPAALEDLIDPAYKGLTVVENPATSSPGLAFLLATVGHWGREGYLDYWRALYENEVWVESNWKNAYYGQFSAASDGDRPIVVSYATSPAAEVYYSEGAYEVPPTGAVLSPGSCFRQIEFVGILKGTLQRKLAEAFVDWMLSKSFQEDIPLHMWVFPANREAELPQVFVDFAQQAQEPAAISADDIAAYREEWIAAWTEVVLR